MRRKVRLGISSCLLGERVRYDGGHKLDQLLCDALGKFVEYVPVCPEAECGLGVPREAMRLVGRRRVPRLVTVETGIDYTERMAAWARERVVALERERLCGFVFKAGSPSCGMRCVAVYGRGGARRLVGTGIWARAFAEHFPLLPAEEEGRLRDRAVREDFIERVLAFGRRR